MSCTVDSDQNIETHGIAPEVSHPQHGERLSFKQLEPSVAAHDDLADEERERQRSSVTMKNALNAAAPVNRDTDGCEREWAGEGRRGYSGMSFSPPLFRFSISAN